MIHILKVNLHHHKKPMSQTLNKQINQIPIFSKILKKSRQPLQMILIVPQLIRTIQMKKQRKKGELLKRQNFKLLHKPIRLLRIQLAKLLQYSKSNNLRFNKQM
jgi:hypothetical protein